MLLLLEGCDASSEAGRGNARVLAEDGGLLVLLPGLLPDLPSSLPPASLRDAMAPPDALSVEEEEAEVALSVDAVG